MNKNLGQSPIISIFFQLSLTKEVLFLTELD